ncbi:MAG: biotin-dependent carboxyltransferase family protein [Anaerovibrio sp.]|uniref:5-oxoprolinase subunit C family protein n=1 Tax=Anaerovibrio sp. TaxID=1872532 RepID=UPI0025DEFB83|nr:biotin-dependent carboxyltransferase family protein [Anaerovibrio sp.]MCR5175487.1 biotin-dependent carboxyltransferase family protein [Anaerovibrio sp.]
MSIKILNGGLMTTVQDMGRFGYQASGMQVSGVMDVYSASIANTLVGNDVRAAVLETTFLGPELEIMDSCLIAVAGGLPELMVDGQKVECYKALRLNKGQKLRCGGMSQGIRSYIAVAGGFSVPEILESRSTNLKLGIGGLEGRQLAAGDILAIGEPSDFAKAILAGKAMPGSCRPVTGQGDVTELRVVLGPQDNYFSSTTINEVFAQGIYTVSNNSDRMGYRLEGEPVKWENDKDMITDGIVFGSVQIPPNGQPIIMMADHQTTGGYPKIATVISADLPVLAQCTPGTRVHFSIVTVQEAQRIYREFVSGLNNRLENIKRSPVGKNKVVNYELKVNGQLFQVSVEEM